VKIQFVSGRLAVGEAMSPPLIRRVKKSIDNNALPTIIIDAPPGASCPAVTAVNGSDFCLIVTEPTPFGAHDMKLAVSMLRHLNIPFGVIINRCPDIDTDCPPRRPTNADPAAEYCSAQNLPVLMRIPFDRKIAAESAVGKPMILSRPDLAVDFAAILERIVKQAVQS
jgi:MinD superfamily P-loop ATPase